MADVQLENGYTQIANEILENMAKIKLSPTQYRLLFVIWRYTYGFKRVQHELSLSFLSEATGLDQRNIQRALADLEKLNVITQEIKNGSYRKIAFVKNHDLWKSSIGEINKGAIGETNKATIGETDKEERKSKEKYKEKTYIDFPINGGIFFQIYNHYFFNKFKKPHMRIAQEKEAFIHEQIKAIESQIDVEDFKRITEYHFENLPKSNNGNILAFIQASKRYIAMLLNED